MEHLYAVDSLERDQRYNNDNDINIVDDVDDEQFRCYDTSLSKSVNDWLLTKVVIPLNCHDFM